MLTKNEKEIIKYLDDLIDTYNNEYIKPQTKRIGLGRGQYNHFISACAKITAQEFNATRVDSSNVVYQGYKIYPLEA